MLRTDLASPEATYAIVHEQYRMMDPGASMGKGYGPILVAKEPIPRDQLEQKVVAIPGSHTTAALLLRLHQDVAETLLMVRGVRQYPHPLLERHRAIAARCERRITIEAGRIVPEPVAA